jgi:RimJ/RimL family protein N-acetyltransferase
VTDFISRNSNKINIPGTWFQFVIIEHDSDILIGDIGIHFLESDSENKQAEIGYTLDRNSRGKGYATEALTEIINYLIKDLNKHRIIASIDPTNNDSIRLIERLGFRKEGHFKKSLFFHGEWVDDLIYAILAEEWNRKD